MDPTMSLALSTTVMWSFAAECSAECSLLSPDLLRSDVLRPWLCGFRCGTCRLSPKSPSLIIPHYPSPFPTVSRRLEDHEARLRLIFEMVVTSPPPKPDPQICSSSGETHAQLLLFQRVHRKSEPPSLSPLRCVPPGRTLVLPFIDPPSPRRSSRSHHRLLLIPRSSNVTLGFHCLGQWMGCLLGQKLMVVLLGRKWRVYFLGLIPTLSPLHYTYRSLSCFISVDRIRSHLIKISLLCSRSACSFAVSVTTNCPLLFAQVRSCSSLSNSSTFGRYWMNVESLALIWRNSGLVITLSMICDSRGSTFVLSSGTFIALVRPFTAVCRLYFGLTLLRVDLMQFGQRSLFSLTVPVILVHWGFHSPHLSFKELVILPNTSLVFSGIVIGSIVVKTGLLGADARIVVQDGSRSAFVDGLTLEALFPPPCGFGKDFRFQDVSLETNEASVLYAFNLDFSSGESLPGSRR